MRARRDADPRPPRLHDAAVGLCDVSYSLNKSHSKKISIGLECYKDFELYVKIYKCGKDVVSLTYNEWEIFHHYFAFIDTFFADTTSPRVESDFPSKTLAICEGEKAVLHFRELYKKKVIVLETWCRQTDLQREVYLAEESWIGLRRVLPCVQQAVANRYAWSSVISEWYLQKQLPVFVKRVLRKGRSYERGSYKFIEECLAGVFKKDNDLTSEHNKCLAQLEGFAFSQFCVEMDTFFIQRLADDVKEFTRNGTDVGLTEEQKYISLRS
jgi:hypothetical protein